ncbi:putative spermidine/putrescine transport system permease protein [Pseudonocardia sediminis]|uniref:Putative spermidine/putrescine transport system permease protein n=1 Tax=Pseudonocardia sediminis TaxID=1397368 RepID=A0A4Q7USB3_PSEST|nr:sugar ABC transporter permease [Pseudonocardia sediminis]RZT83854.1 putative spermidine/putrescine transport system permease protein [Pseudonocardia sediminis]
MITRIPRGLRIALLLTPALAVVVLLFGGGLLQALAQSLGHRPFLPPAPLGFDAYRELAADPAVRASVGLTVRVGLVSTAGAAVLGTAAALLVASLGRTRRGFAALLQVTLPVPHIVAALAVTLLLSQSGTVSRLAHAAGLIAEPAGFPALTQDAFGWGIVASYLWKEAPFVAVVVLAALSGRVAALTDAARVLGANRWQRVRHVVLPAVAPAVGAASVLVFAFTVGSYEVPFLLGRPFPATLPVLAYEQFRDPDLAARPLAMALALVTALLTGACVAAYVALTRRLSR